MTAKSSQGSLAGIAGGMARTTGEARGMRKWRELREAESEHCRAGWGLPPGMPDGDAVVEKCN